MLLDFLEGLNLMLSTHLKGRGKKNDDRSNCEIFHQLDKREMIQSSYVLTE